MYILPTLNTPFRSCVYRTLNLFAHILLSHVPVKMNTLFSKQSFPIIRHVPNMIQKTEQKDLIGWREWVALPKLGIKHLKCKIDTGARSSALHAFYVETFEENGIQRVRFGIHPRQRDTDKVVECVTDVIDERVVTDSGGHQEKRIVIHTTVVMGPHVFPVDMTLTNRDTMRFRMLLGRTGMIGRFTVDPEKSYLLGKKQSKTGKR